MRNTWLSIETTLVVAIFLILFIDQGKRIYSNNTYCFMLVFTYIELSCSYVRCPMLLVDVSMRLS